ncbi:MAG: glycosyltransferase [Actinobacteria bacterium]|nr:glycosyltransferase [Actinomycetota bacterium]
MGIPMKSDTSAEAPIVSVVFNDVEFDSRVRTVAASLASAGAEVVILGIGFEPGDAERELGSVRMRILGGEALQPRGYRALDRSAESLRRLRVGSEERRRGRMAPLRAAAKEARRVGRRSSEAERPAAEADAAVAQRRLVRARRGYAPRRAAEAGLKRIERQLRKRALRSLRQRRAVYRLRRLTEELIALAPGAIHANDADGLTVAVDAARALERRGPRPPIVYDAHEWTVGRESYVTPPPGMKSEVELEGKAIGRADAVITVSEPLADLLAERYSLDARPLVVYSAPPAALARATGVPGLRELTGLSGRERLLVYVGRIAERRGVYESVSALSHLPSDVHLVLIGPMAPGHAAKLQRLAERDGLAERMHLLEPVSPDDLLATIRDADLALMPLHRNRQHEVTMPNKVFQYAQAGLPVVASDCGAVSRFVRLLGIGRLFEHGDARSLAKVAGRVLERHERISERLAAPGVRWLTSWEATEPVLLELYRRLGVLPTPGPSRAAPGSPRVRIGIGPRNGNGQAWLLARALERSMRGSSAESFKTEFPSGPLEFDFPCDVSISREDWKSLAVQAERAQRLISRSSHLLVEQGLSVFGHKLGDPDREIALLRGSGVEVAFWLRGSEIRDPDRHAEREPFSPFRGDFGDPELLERVRKRNHEIRALIEAHGLPAFVSSTDLLEDLPGATWLPLIVDPGEWDPGEPVPACSPPRVLHAPPKEWTKGSALIDAICEPLHRQGVIAYRRLRGVPHRRMPGEIRDADVVIDQLVMGSHGTLGLQAMACERVVVSYVSEFARRHLPGELPVVSATPETLEAVLRELVADPDRMRRLGAAGRAYVERHHSGAASAEALRPWLQGVDRSA